MSLEEKKTIVRSLYKAVNSKDLSSTHDFLVQDYIDHTIKIQGLENYKQFGMMIFKAFPDFHITIKDIIAEGDKV